MGLKEVQEYMTKLKKVEKLKEIREQVSLFLSVIIQYFSRYVRDGTRTVVWEYRISSTRVFMAHGSSWLSEISYLLLCV